MSWQSPTVAFHTLGCKLNFAETAAIARTLSDYGYSKLEFSEPADFFVINTCSVTENADKETKQIVKRALKSNPDAKVIIIGCYAQLKPEAIAAIPGVSMVLGAKEKFKLHEHISKLETAETAIIESGEIEDVAFFSPAWSQGERTRTFLKVQDGCDYHCAFCTIPLARGASRSNTVAATIASAKKAAESGVKEIVLTGVNIGDFGKTPDGSQRTEETFFELIKALDKEVEVQRFRISSIEPNLLSEEIIRFVAKSEKFMPHFHIPLQSGSNRILKFMRRKYLRELYAERVAVIKSVMPHACIGVDVIVGFPGETEQDFFDTYNFLNELDVSYLHVFTYSERANTRAVNMNEVVPMEERKKRNKMLRILSEKKRVAFYRQHENTNRSVLWEAEKSGEEMNGYTDNYIKVSAPYNAEWANTITDFEISFTGENTLVEAL